MRIGSKRRTGEETRLANGGTGLNGFSEKGKTGEREATGEVPIEI
jgi:hypothetical protein